MTSGRGNASSEQGPGRKVENGEFKPEWKR